MDYSGKMRLRMLYCAKGVLMMASENLSRAKATKNDEFYTLYDYIQKEINAYLEFNPNVFRDKIVLLPCDDPEWSNFTRFFAQNFENFGLKKLISTSYAADSKPEFIPYQISLFESEAPHFDESKTRNHGKIFTLTRDKNQSGKIDIDDLEWDYLEGDGDFRSDEIKVLRDEADIIVTNPPFSKFRDFLAWIVEAGKLILFCCFEIAKYGVFCYNIGKNWGEDVMEDIIAFLRTLFSCLVEFLETLSPLGNACSIIGLTWVSLPKYFDANDNEPLRKAVISDNQYAYTPIEAQRIYLINEYKSYCTAINGGIITLFCKQKGNDLRLAIGIQTDPSHYLQSPPCDSEIEEMLRELLLQLSANIDDGVKFINDILNM